MPLDGGNYLFTEEEKEEFIQNKPLSEKWFRPWIGSYGFINRCFRYCLYLKKCPPDELRKMPVHQYIVIAKFKSGMIEAWGRGFDKIKDACAKYDGRLPEYTISASGIVSEL